VERDCERLEDCLQEAWTIKISPSSFPLVMEGNGGWIPALARASYKRQRSLSDCANEKKKEEKTI